MYFFHIINSGKSAFFDVPQFSDHVFRPYCLHRLLIRFFLLRSARNLFLLFQAPPFLELSTADSCFRPCVFIYYGFDSTAAGCAEIWEPGIVTVQRNFDPN